MIRAVFATNVLVSALFNPNRPPAQLLELALQGKIRLIVSPHLIAEIERVLTYPKVKKLLKKRNSGPGEVAEAIAKILKVAVWTPGDLTVEAVAADPSDDMVLAGAVEGSADFIVSGDHHLLDLKNYQGIKIVNPARFLELMEGE
ncbi:MAG: putative toxin-antitoxin system toxin component, PIN family [Desulfobaccales bacterium]